MKPSKPLHRDSRYTLCFLISVLVGIGSTGLGFGRHPETGHPAPMWLLGASILMLSTVAWVVCLGVSRRW
jgi:hypothetical protein